MEWIDLTPGGEGWKNWYLGKFGRAKEWRLHTPTGVNFTPDEILAIPYLTANVAHYEARVAKAEALVDPDAMHLGPMDAVALVEAAERILRAARDVGLVRLKRRLREERLKDVLART